MKRLETESISSEERWELIERICASSELKRAARLRELLQFVGHRALQEDHVQISEYEIGVHVFNRPENYDTSSDNIVRVNASELRKRLAAYYAMEGADEKVLIDIPRGSYLPKFSLRPDCPPDQTEEPNSATLQGSQDKLWKQPPEQLSAWSRMRPHGSLVVALILASICMYFAYQLHTLRERLYEWKSEQTLGPFWAGILETPRDTDVVVADTSVATVESMLNQRISLTGYLDHAYVEQIQSSDLSPELKSDLQQLAARSNGSISDFRVAQRILDLDPNSSNVHLQYAREYRPRNAAGHNIILIGSSVSNPWTSLFEDRLNFVVTYDSAGKRMVVQNRRPRQGESALYAAPTNPSSTDYSVIDYIPNQDHSADVLILAGTGSVATEAAGDFLTKEDSLRRFAEALHSRTLPYFELLLKTTRLQGAPITAEIVAYRTFSH